MAGRARSGWLRRWYQPQLERAVRGRRRARRRSRCSSRQIAAALPTRERFLTELTLDPPQATATAGVPLLDEDYLILSTIHSAKGQEWTRSSS
jgi:DNA helicase II / ATP-dependent DNA helicase PcrA